MFRLTITLLVIFLLTNHPSADARSLEYESAHELIKHFQKTNYDDDDEMEVEDTAPVVEAYMAKSRSKRSWGGAIRGGLAFTAGASFGLSVGSTVYHAIQKCDDYRPTDCSKKPDCTHISNTCPNTCKNPSDNREYVQESKERVTQVLDDSDDIQQNAFNLATKAIVAGLNNQRILTAIDAINQKIDELTFSLSLLDVEFATKLRNQSVAIGKLLRNERLSLDEIVSSPEVDGIFDKWTWEGTGLFTLSIALPLSLKGFSYLRQRHAINEIYKNLKTDFEAKFLSQKGNLNPNAKIKNKFAYVKGLRTANFDKQLKATAKAIYAGDQANKQISKTQKFMNNYVTPFVNAIVTALSIWSTYQQINNCIIMTNDMQGTAIDMANKENDIVKIKKEQVDPLLVQVTQEAWPSVVNTITNETTLDYLDGIKNLTEEAQQHNATVPIVIQTFIDQASTAGYDSFMYLQTQLLIALKSVQYEYGCLADKQHAVTTVINDCRAGREPFPDLYEYALTKHKLNRDGCIAKGMIPYTTQEQFEEILNDAAEHFKFYPNCLLNNEDLLYRVCAEEVQGYTDHAVIVQNVNKTGLTEAMVANFLTRCPPPRITPKSIEDTCNYYCLYQPVSSIAKSVILLESQVNDIIENNCSLCPVDADELKKICNLHFCDDKNITTISEEVKIPAPTIKSLLTINCTICNIEDPALRKRMCFNSKCRGFSDADNADDVGLSQSVVEGFLALTNCDEIVASCLDETPQETKDKMFELSCLFVPTNRIAYFMGYTEAVVQQVIAAATATCPPPDWGR